MIGSVKPEDFTQPNSGWLIRSRPYKTTTGQVIATNGAWIVVFDDISGEYDPMPVEKEQHMFKNYLGIMSEPGSKWVPMAALVLPDAVACKNCGGKGVLLFDDCDDCDGVGSFYHGDHSYECKECDGSGSVKSETGATKESCPCCFGLGEEKQEVAISGSKFSAPLIRKLAQLPDAKIRVALRTETKLRNHYELGVIKFYGGTAVIAGLGD